MRPLGLLLVTLPLGCGGLVVFEDEVASSGGGGPATSASGGPSTGPSTGTAGPTTGPSGSGGGSSGQASASSGAGGTGGAPPDGACIAADYCACITVETCRVIAEDCFCSCDEPCSPPCDCECGGGAFLECAPGSIRDPGALDVGVWLVGWSGGLNHFSWLRFDDDGGLQVLQEVDVVGNDPYFPCSGAGSWSFDDDPETVRLELPAGCAPTSLTFGDWRLVPPSPPGAVQEAFLFDAGRGVTLGAWRFPDEACTPSLTSCVDPFAP